MSLNRVLLIWNEVPENLKLYELELADDEFKKLKLCHGRYINGDDDADGNLLWLSEFLVDKQYYFIDDGKCHEVKLFDSISVVVSGFLM